MGQTARQYAAGVVDSDENEVTAQCRDLGHNTESHRTDATELSNFNPIPLISKSVVLSDRKHPGLCRKVAPQS